MTILRLRPWSQGWLQNAWFITIRHRPSADIIRNSLAERVAECVGVAERERERVAERVGVGSPALHRVVGPISLSQNGYGRKRKSGNKI